MNDGSHLREMPERIGEPMTYVQREEVDLSKKVRYAKSVYDVEGLLGVKCWNAGECFIAIVAKMGGANDWAAYVGALPNRRMVPAGTAEGAVLEELLTGSATMEVYNVTEEEVVRYTVHYGGKMLAKEAAALFGLPERQYRR